MKAKDWIKNLEKLDPEKEVYLHYSSNGEDWGYSLGDLYFEQRDLQKSKHDKQWLIYEDNGDGEALGKCNTIRIY